jgi:perosamine synthetase
MSAAVGLAQLEKLDMLLAERRRVANRYTRLLGGLPGIELPYDGPHERSWFVYVVRIDPALERDAVIAGLATRGISARAYMPAIHLQPAYRDLGHGSGSFPVTERVAASTMALPFFIQLEDDDQEYVADSLREVLAGL